MLPGVGVSFQCAVCGCPTAAQARVEIEFHIKRLTKGEDVYEYQTAFHNENCNVQTLCMLL